MKSVKLPKERCDRCKKWVSGETGLMLHPEDESGTNCVCSKCFDIIEKEIKTAKK